MPLRPRQLRPARPSHRVELRYRNALLVIARELASATATHLLPVLRSYEWAYHVGDSLMRDVRDVTSGAVLMAIERAIASISADTVSRMAWRPEALAEAMIGAQNEATKEALRTSIQSAYGLDITALLEGQDIAPTLNLARRMNVELIRSIPSEYLRGLNQRVFLGVQQGARYETLASDIQELYGVTENRAKLIARDQTAKTNAAITQARQTDLGITHYRWSTAGDERVRETHAANEGKVFAWDDPPAETGHPGDDVNCRCVAIPLLGYSENGEEV
ncbi:phage minor head protein [Paraburkholderia sp. BR10936]|uniref:phage head morphogenesis protein n=1 Tax=Paraburkholderia sp. BR10936 TaxID=3236993 RepID=UPI0034D1F57A